MGSPGPDPGNIPASVNLRDRVDPAATDALQRAIAVTDLGDTVGSAQRSLERFRTNVAAWLAFFVLAAIVAFTAYILVDWSKRAPEAPSFKEGACAVGAGASATTTATPSANATPTASATPNVSVTVFPSGAGTPSVVVSATATATSVLAMPTPTNATLAPGPTLDPGACREVVAAFGALPHSALYRSKPMIGQSPRSRSRCPCCFR